MKVHKWQGDHYAGQPPSGETGSLLFPWYSAGCTEHTLRLESSHKESVKKDKLLFLQIE